MLNYNTLSKKPKHPKNFSDLTLQEFNTINQTLNEKYTIHQQKRPQRPNRKRNIGAGHPFTLNLTDRLLMLLMYYKLYTSSTLLGYLFGLSQTNVLKNIWIIEPIIRDVLPLPSKEYAKVKKIESIEELEELFPGFVAFLDATKQEIPRPKNKYKRKTRYSGKKKKHTVKT